MAELRILILGLLDYHRFETVKQNLVPVPTGTKDKKMFKCKKSVKNVKF